MEVIRELRLKLSGVHYYSDSSIVLGYLTNDTRSFTRFVTRRVEAIKRHTRTGTWHYVATDVNPADLATRPISPGQLKESMWFEGPAFLHQEEHSFEAPETAGDLPETLPAAVGTFRAATLDAPPLVQLVERRSNWHLIVRVVKLLVKFYRIVRNRVSDVPPNLDIPTDQAERLLFRSSQMQSFPELCDENFRPL